MIDKSLAGYANGVLWMHPYAGWWVDKDEIDAMGVAIISGLDYAKIDLLSVARSGKNNEQPAIVPGPSWAYSPGTVDDATIEWILSHTPEPIEGRDSARVGFPLDEPFADTIRDLFAYAVEMFWPLVDASNLYSAWLHRYDVGQGKLWHCDGALGTDRRWLGLIIACDDSDAYEGGEIHLVNETPWSLERGDVLFIAGHTAHRVIPVTAGTRRTVTAFAY